MVEVVDDCAVAAEDWAAVDGHDYCGHPSPECWWISEMMASDVDVITVVAVRIASLMMPTAYEL